MGILSDTTADNGMAGAATAMNQAAPAASNDQTPAAGGGEIGGAINALTGGAISDVMGLIFGGAQDNRQYNQQNRLDQLTLGYNEQAADYAQQENMKTWYETNYPAQVQQLEKAGLNPALLYAKGGQGGVLGNTSVAPVAGAQAADAAQTTGANTQMAMMGIQLQQMQAQTELMKAQANKANVEATKEAGVDTQNVLQNTATQKAQQESLLQGINNQEAQQKLTEAQTKIANIQGTIADQTIGEQLAIVENTSKILAANSLSAQAQADVDQATWQTKIKMLSEQLGNIIANTAYTNAQTNNMDYQTTITKYKAGLAEVGINPDSPWYVNIIGSIAKKFGVTPNATGEAVNKITQ